MSWPVEPPPIVRAPVSWRFAVLPGLFLLLWYLLTMPGAIAPRISDDRSMYLVTQALVDRHDVALQDPYEPQLQHGWQPPRPPSGTCPTEGAALGVGTRRGGPVFSKYGLGQSLAAIPLYVLGERLASLVSPPYRAEVPAFATSAYNSLITALTAVLLCALALRLGWSRRVALALVLLFGLATPAWAYTTTFFSEPTIALCLLAALATMLWHEGPPSPTAALLTGGWLGAATLVRLDSALYIPLYALYALAAAAYGRTAAPRPYGAGHEAQSRLLPDGWLRLLVLLAIGPAIALLVIGAYDLARFGNPITTGYNMSGGPGYNISSDYHDTHPPHTLQALWEGIYGQLLSPGKGLFLYAPILLMLPWALAPFARRYRRGALLLVLGIAAIAVLAHANTLIVWLGGWAWGPRFLISIIPVLLLPLGALLQGAGPWVRRVAWTLGLLGVLIQVPAVLLDKGVYISHLEASVPGQCIWRAEDLYKWHPRYSPLIGQWQRLLDAQTYQQAASVRAQQLSLQRQSGQSAVTVQRTIAEGWLTPAPQAWWELLSLQGISWRDLALPLVLLAALASLFLWLAVRALGRTELGQHMLHPL
ncbi:MAG TPA: hypothetical protein VHB98_24730 [Chloroflexota bacterium]|nr:hypothetical protein [Chloroflexota bacterium]